MNIFYLDKDIDKCVEYHCDRHVCKMIIEYCQILSTASTLYGGTKQGYKPTHKNHPCVKWCKRSVSNWAWLKSLALALCKEYTYRYKKTHKTQSVIENLNLPQLPITSTIDVLPKCMDMKYQISNSEDWQSAVVDSYRNYYIKEKYKIAKWTQRDIPYWFSEN